MLRPKSVFLLCLLIVAGCKTIRHTTMTGDPIYFEKEATLIFAAIPDKTDKESLVVFEAVAQHLTDECLTLMLIPEMDYDLQLRGINADSVVLGDPENLRKLNDWIPNAYLVELIPVIGPYASSQSQVGKSKLTTRVRSVQTNQTWEYLTMAEITSVKLNEKAVNVFASPFYLGVRESLDYIVETSVVPCH